MIESGRIASVVCETNGCCAVKSLNGQRIENGTRSFSFLFYFTTSQIGEASCETRGTPGALSIQCCVARARGVIFGFGPDPLLALDSTFKRSKWW